MKECDKRKSHIIGKIHTLHISSNNVRHPVTKTFTILHPNTRNATSLHLSTLHFLSFKLHLATLHYILIWLNPIEISYRSISPHITTLHLTSHKSNPSSVLRGIVDSYSTPPWVTWEAVTFVEGTPWWGVLRHKLVNGALVYPSQGGRYRAEGCMTME